MNSALATCAAAALLWCGAARAEPVQAEHIEADLVAENIAFRAGAENWVALRLRPDTGWHTYWRNPGDSGLATRLAWVLPEGVTAGEIHWPHPDNERLGELVNYGYDAETFHLVPIQVPAGWPTDRPLRLEAEAKWLVCSDICIPGTAIVSLELPVVGSAPEADPVWSQYFAETRAKLPKTVSWPARFATDAQDFSLAVEVPPEAPRPFTAQLFPIPNDLVNHAAAQRIEIAGDRLHLSQQLSSFFVKAPEQIDAVLVLEADGSKRAYAITAKPGDVEPLPGGSAPLREGQAAPAAEAPPGRDAGPGLGLALLSALLGGLILNLMPCVFPVLSIKAIAVLEANAGLREQRTHALFYTAGVVISCLVIAALLLALRAGGQALGWGFQLQSPVFVGATAYLLFALGLSLSGVVPFGMRWMGLGQSLTQRPGHVGSFMTGVLALVVASPCTAPFMGSALGYAITQPAPIALTVFAALGLGLALPFLLLAFIPGAARAMPRPGAWMETFKQVMAFPLYLTVVWLVWVLARQTGANGAGIALVGIVLIALSLWLWGRPPSPRRASAVGALLVRYLALAAALALLTSPQLRAVAAQSTAARPADASWQTYSDTRLAELRAANQRVFVNLTADWCLTCLANERVALRDAGVLAAFASGQVAYLKGDWTNADPAITAVLERYGRSGVPLYLYFKPGAEGEILPQLLTSGLLLAKFKE